MYPLLHIDGKLTISSKEWCLVKWTTKSRRESNRIFIDSNVCFGVFVQASCDKIFIAYTTNQCSWMKMNDMNNREQKRNTVGFAPCACWIWHNSFCGGKNGGSSNHPIQCFKDYHFCLSASWVSGKMWPTPPWQMYNDGMLGTCTPMED